MAKSFDSKKANGIQNRLFDFRSASSRAGSWWWWFMILIFNNPKNKAKPRQLMILWSTKKDKQIECNDLNIVLDHAMEAASNGERVDGAVTSWYYDGVKMRHNFLLKQTPLLFSENSIETENIKTGLCRTKKGFKLKIRNDMSFDLFFKEKNIFTMPTYDNKKILGFDYDLLRMNKLALTGSIDGEKVYGSAYLQRVFLNAPALPWYWGIFYFKEATLTYFKIHLGKKLGEIPFKKDIQFYYKGKLHKIRNIAVRRTTENGLPVFDIKGEDEKVSVDFKVVPYSVSHWKFRKRMFGFGSKSTFVWYEYPATLKKFRFLDKETGKELTEKDLGIGIGNAEQSSGFLI